MESGLQCRLDDTGRDSIMSFPNTVLIWLLSAVDPFGQKANQGDVLVARQHNQRIHTRDGRVANPISDMTGVKSSPKPAVTTAVPDEVVDILPEQIKSKVSRKGGTRDQ